MDVIRKTELNKWHHQNGGKMVNFAGWEMPVQYSKGISEEHLFTRTQASLFDVSHMGEFRFNGDEALDFLEFLSPSRVSKLNDGGSCYSFFTNESGGVVDDLLIYCFEKKSNYLICVNASNTQKIKNHIDKYKFKFNVEVQDECYLWGQVAIQGPQAVKMAEEYIPGVSALKRFSFGEFETLGGYKVCAARTGYTGEDGFEIFVDTEKVKTLWESLLELGAEPCGLGARDTLRLEAALNLYGNELNDHCNPYERRLGWTIDLDKGEFLGKEKVQEFKTSASAKLVGLKVLDRVIPRTGYEIFHQDLKVGVVTSGTRSPSLNESIAIALIDKKALEGEKNLKIQIRRKEYDVEIVSLPFLKKNK